MKTFMEKMIAVRRDFSDNKISFSEFIIIEREAMIDLNKEIGEKVLHNSNYCNVF
jgi:hypothetical protein